MSSVRLGSALFRWLPRGMYFGLRRYWNIAELAWLRPPVDESIFQSIPKGGVVLDVGAAIGTFTKHLSKLVGPAGRVIAIEPMQQSFDALQGAVRLYGLHNVTAIHAAASDTVREGWMKAATYDAGAPNFYESRISEKDQGTQAVKIITIDSLNLERLDYMKIDVEEHEISVLTGARETIKRCRPVMYVEVWSSESREFLLSFGYKVVYEDTESSNVLCVPIER